MTPSSVSVGTIGVSLTPSHSASPLPPVRGFPALRVHMSESDFHRRIGFPQSDSFGRPTRPAGRDGDGSPRFLTHPFLDVPCSQTPPQSPAVIAICDRLLLPSRYSTLSACGCRLTRLNRFTCVMARPSLCLPLAHVVTSISPRLDSRWGGLAPCRSGNFTRWMRQAWPGAPK